MDDLTKALSQIRTTNFSEYPDVNQFEKPMESGLWALWILQDKFGFHDQHFTPDILETVLLKKGVQFSGKEISKSFSRAGKKLHNIKDVNGRPAHMIMQKGKDYLAKFGGKGNLEVIFVEGNNHRTIYRKFEDLINKTKGNVKIVDKFYSRSSLDVIEQWGKNRKIQFLTATLSGAENSEKFQTELSRFRKEFKNVEIRKYSKEYELHDRYILTSDFLILIGRGIQELGEKESFIISFSVKSVQDMWNVLTAKFDERWNKSSNIK